MKVQKEIENVTRVPNRYPIEPLTMEDAVLFHKKVVDNYEKMRKDLNKELGIGDIEEEGFTGRTDEKVSTPELKKMRLSESLFNEQLENTDGWPEEIGDELSGAFETLNNLQYEINSCVRGAYTDCDNIEDLVEYIIDSANFLIDRAEYLKFNSQSLNEELEETEDWPEEVRRILRDKFEEFHDLEVEIENYNSDISRGEYISCEDANELADYIEDLANRLTKDAEYLRSEADRLNEDIIDVGERVKQQEEEKARTEAEEKRKKEQEEETKRLIQQDEARAKAEKEREEKWAKEEAEKEREQQYRDNLWREKDWNAELKKAGGDWNKVNFTGYDDADIETIKNIYANQDERDKRAYERAKAKEEAEKQSKERQEKIEKAKNAIKSLPNNLKATANKAGINI